MLCIQSQKILNIPEDLLDKKGAVNKEVCFFNGTGSYFFI